MLVAIDPGKLQAGVAVFDDHDLAAAWLTQAKNPRKGLEWLATAHQVWIDLLTRFPLAVLSGIEVAVEQMQIYTQNKQKGRQEDVLAVAYMTAAVIAGAPECCRCVDYNLYPPAVWKRTPGSPSGQTPKKIQAERTKKKLSKDERDRVELPGAKKAQLDVWDAVGIGLFHLRR